VSVDQITPINIQIQRAWDELNSLTDPSQPSGSDGISLNYDAKHDQLMNRIITLNELLLAQQPPATCISRGITF
jgi:hypothetical protein